MQPERSEYSTANCGAALRNSAAHVKKEQQRAVYSVNTLKVETIKEKNESMQTMPSSCCTAQRDNSLDAVSAFVISATAIGIDERSIESASIGYPFCIIGHDKDVSNADEPKQPQKQSQRGSQRRILPTDCRSMRLQRLQTCRRWSQVRKIIQRGELYRRHVRTLGNMHSKSTTVRSFTTSTKENSFCCILTFTQ